VKILCFTPLPYGDGTGWWSRDLALTVRGFRELGHEAWLVCWPTTHPKDPTGRPVLLITPEMAASPNWWQSQNPDAVLLGLWTMPKYDAIRAAALSATPRIVERCDSDGVRLPSSNHRVFFRNQVVAAWDRAPSSWKLLSACAAAGKCLAYELAAPYLQIRLRRTLRLLPFFLSETPTATLRLQRLAQKLGTPAEKFRHIPHPIDTQVFHRPRPAPPKRPVIVSVGRWQALQKDWPLLQATLRGFLDQRPEFEAVVFGPGAPYPSPHSRITLRGSVPPDAIARELQTSQILFFSSRYESFLLAGAEALCCGCSVVGPKEVASAEYFSSFFGGSPPVAGNPRELARALVQEADQWHQSRRDPQAIASRAQASFSHLHVAGTILSLFEEIGAAAK